MSSTEENFGFSLPDPKILGTATAESWEKIRHYAIAEIRQGVPTDAQFEDRADAVQNALSNLFSNDGRALKRIAGLKEEDAGKRYLRRVGRHAYLGLKRGAAKLQEFQEAKTQPQQRPQDATAQSEAIIELINLLSPESRLIARLHLAGMSEEEMAIELGYKVSYIAWLKSRAKSSIRMLAKKILNDQ